MRRDTLAAGAPPLTSLGSLQCYPNALADFGKMVKKTEG